jgi:hypothetical protein
MGTEHYCVAQPSKHAPPPAKRPRLVTSPPPPPPPPSNPINDASNLLIYQVLRDLGQQVNCLGARLTGLQDQVSSLKELCTNFRNNFSTLNTQIEEAFTAFDMLEERLDLSQSNSVQKRWLFRRVPTRTLVEPTLPPPLTTAPVQRSSATLILPRSMATQQQQQQLPNASPSLLGKS